MTTTELIDAELRTRGASLERFARARGLQPLDIVRQIEGQGPRDLELLNELAAEIGVSLRSLVGLQPAATGPHAAYDALRAE